MNNSKCTNGSILLALFSHALLVASCTTAPRAEFPQPMNSAPATTGSPEWFQLRTEVEKA